MLFQSLIHMWCCLCNLFATIKQFIYICMKKWNKTKGTSRLIGFLFFNVCLASNLLYQGFAEKVFFQVSTYAGKLKTKKKIGCQCASYCAVSYRDDLFALTSDFFCNLLNPHFYSTTFYMYDDNKRCSIVNSVNKTYDKKKCPIMPFRLSNCLFTLKKCRISTLKI